MFRIGQSIYRATTLNTLKRCATLSQRALHHHESISKWATCDPHTLSGKNSVKIQNLVNGKWTDVAKYKDIIDPINGEAFVQAPVPTDDELTPFVDSLASVPKTGLHNPLKNPHRYVDYGQVSFRVAEMLLDPVVLDHFARLIQRVCPKSHAQAIGEVTVTRKFFQNFGADQVRFLAKGFTTPGDHAGQQSTGYRFPYGPVAIVAPFNFPLEIPVLQLMGALYMGNKVVIKAAETTALVLEQFIRMLHYCGMPMDDVDLVNCKGSQVFELLKRAPVRLVQFTGSSHVAELLAKELHGKVRVEDAGFDWKILGPDVGDVDYVSWQSDQDAYGSSGQKCSAQSMLFMHENWAKTNFLKSIQKRASTRKLDDLTVGPILTESTDRMLTHMQRILDEVEGSCVLFGGKELQGHSIPKQYGAIEPTAVFVPLKELLKPGLYELCTEEIFGPFQVITKYNDDEIDMVIECCERMSHHLTAAVVSNDVYFLNHVLSNTVNGTTYAGRRARTTGAPQNHWFGPCGDPRGAGIGTPEAIKLVWSCHREIINDFGPVPSDAPKEQS